MRRFDFDWTPEKYNPSLMEWTAKRQIALFKHCQTGWKYAVEASQISRNVLLFRSFMEFAWAIPKFIVLAETFARNYRDIRMTVGQESACRTPLPEDPYVKIRGKSCVCTRGCRDAENPEVIKFKNLEKIHKWEQDYANVKHIDTEKLQLPIRLPEGLMSITCDKLVGSHVELAALLSDLPLLVQFKSFEVLDSAYQDTFIANGFRFDEVHKKWCRYPHLLETFEPYQFAAAFLRLLNCRRKCEQFNLLLGRKNEKPWRQIPRSVPLSAERTHEVLDSDGPLGISVTSWDIRSKIWYLQLVRTPA
eukprot:GHVO01050865.1.p1 GENE.GHVO01050865.1~~GHVO01050865.1.p1  ORF type:complete len:305 (-),score=10.32 GHVO01050865.1:39-953(-)